MAESCYCLRCQQDLWYHSVLREIRQGQVAGFSTDLVGLSKPTEASFHDVPSHFLRFIFCSLMADEMLPITNNTGTAYWNTSVAIFPTTMPPRARPAFTALGMAAAGLAATGTGTGLFIGFILCRKCTCHRWNPI